MIDIEVQKARHGRAIKIWGRMPAAATMTVTIKADGIVHIYSPGAEMTHDDWVLLSDNVDDAIAEMTK